MIYMFVIYMFFYGGDLYEIFKTILCLIWLNMSDLIVF